MKHKTNTYSDNYNSSFDESISRRKKLNSQLVSVNFIISIISIVAIISLLMGDFWSVGVEYKVDGAKLEQLMANGGALPEGVEIDYSSLDIDVAFGVSLAFPSDSLIVSAFEDNTTAVSKLLDDTLANVIGTATDLVHQVFRAGVKFALATALDEIKTNEEIADLVNNLDLAPVESIIDELFEESPDTAQIENDLISLIQTQIESAGESFTPQMEDEIHNSYTQIITELSDDEGNFSLYSAVSVMLDEAGMSMGDTGTVVTEEQLSMAVRNEILSAMGPDAINYVAIAYKVIGGLLLFTIAMWAFLLLSTVLHTFSNKKGVKMWYVVLWCALPYLLMVGVLKLVSIYGMDYAKAYLGSQASILDGLAINASGNTYISAICVAILIVISLGFYARLRKNAKRA
ncbi:MAG: hypothetical protein PHE93_05825 [Clostridia bacterium]|nr:hypothetical protein [Clostridia bacterium]